MLTLFFRKPSENFHSIENLFFSLKKYFEKHFETKIIFLPYHKSIGRLLNLFYVWTKRDKINHITGDVNYISLALPKKNTILTIHDIGSALNANHNKLKLRILKLLWFEIPIRRAKIITTISEFSKNEIIKNFKSAKNKIIVIPNPVANHFKASPPPKNTKPIILHIGTKENKNLCSLINAIENLNCKLIIIGKLTEKQKKLLTNKNIDFQNLINISNEELVRTYQKSNLLFFGSFYEGFGMPILEAQAVGRPVITSNLSPMKEVAGQGALLIDPYNIQEIRQAIIQIITNQELYNQLITQGFENVKKYSAQKIAKQYIQVYQKVYNNQIK